MDRFDGWAHFRAIHRHTEGACSTAAGLIDILDAVDIPIVVLGRDFTITCFNHAAANLLDLTPSALGQSPHAASVLAGMQDLEDWCTQAMETGTAYRHEFRDRNRSYLVRIAPHTLSDSRISGSVLTFANVTAFRASIDQAVYEREYTKTILNTVIDPLAVLSDDLRVLTGNRAFYTMFRLSRDTTPGIPLGEIGNRAFEVAALNQRLQQTLTNGGDFEPIEIEHDFPDIGHRIISVNVRYFSLPTRSVGMLLLALRDITEQRRAEKELKRHHEELRDRERWLRELIEGLPAAVYTTDAAGWITFYNRAAVEFAGREPQLGTDRWCVSWRLFRADGTPLPHDECPMAIALKENRPLRGNEAVAERPDGTRITFVANPTPLHNSSGALVGAVNMLIDITERKKTEEALQRLAETLEERISQRTRRLEEEISEREKAEAALRQSHKMEAVGQLTGGIAHDFNNLLTVVTGNLDLLDRWTESNAAAHRHVEAAQRAAWQGARLAQQLLAFARRQDLRPEMVHLGHAMTEYEGLLRRALGESIELRIAWETNLWLSYVDRTQFENSILNLAFNARDAMPAGGRLEISMRNAKLSRSQAPPNVVPGSYVLVSVEDSGVGIEPDRLDRVFEPFYTTKEIGRGTGLGLSQVYGFVEQSGGHIRIESTIGIGTTVLVYLPKATGKPDARILPDTPNEELMKGSETVLLVEDNEGVLDIVTTMIEKLGYHVLTAQSGPEALSVLKRGEPIDLLFTDMVMPQGMSGAELAERALQMRPKLKILLGSGYSAKLSAAAGAAAASFPIIGKPYRQSELATKLRNVLRAVEG